MSTGQCNVPSAPFSWRNYFVACWSRSEPVYHFLRSACGRFRFLKASVLKLGKRIWGYIFPKIKKRALLIGIRHDDDPNTLALTGPHRDVRSLRQLLIDVYGYKETDIVVMLDGGMTADPYLAPTRENILREIRELVKDAKSGDHFTFHFSGHSTQLTNKTGTEEDGMDEALIPMDGNYLIDNLLRKHLVDPLPLGSTLVALFDTCHSGSLLDLPHYRCNRVYVPWLSSGKSSMPLYDQGQFVTNDMASRNASRNTDSPVSEQPTWSSINSPSPRMGSVCEESALESEKSWRPASAEPVLRYSSPPPTVKCDGFKLCDDYSAEVPHVIALGACKDAQNAWEDINGHSMTAVLVELLEKDPNPRLNDLMKALSHNTYETICTLHAAWKEWETNRKKEGRGTVNRPAQTPEEEEEDRQYAMLQMSNPLKRFQDPQLASHTKLDMNMMFVL